jgi:hypothetical protein
MQGRTPEIPAAQALVEMMTKMRMNDDPLHQLISMDERNSPRCAVRSAD